jgi:hypothetical protein
LRNDAASIKISFAGVFLVYPTPDFFRISRVVMMLSTVAAFYDESGKLKDHDVVSIGCVAGYVERFNTSFGQEWESLLNYYGIKVLSGKKVLNHKIPLSQKRPCLGIEERSAALLPFIRCMRKHAQMIVGLATDVKAFKKLPSHFFEVYGNDPILMTFVRTTMHVTDVVHPCRTGHGS